MGTVHFRVGANFGRLLTDIAREKLQYEYNYEQALNTFKESLGLNDDELAMEIIRGYKVLEVDIETQHVLVVNRIEADQNDLIDLFDEKEWFAIKMNDLKDEAKELKNAIDNINTGRDIFLNVSMKAMVNFYLNDQDPEYLIEDFEYESRVEQVRIIVKLYLKLIDKAMILLKLQNKINSKSLYPYQEVELLRTSFDMLAKGKKYKESEVLYQYIEAQREIDEKAKTKIEPNPITDNNDAGWIDREGNWYGLNGEIANMLHNQLADMLLEAGYIPEDYEGNPDGWLTQNGWVRVHNNWVLYDGYSNKKYGIGEDIPLTKEQKHTLYLRGQYMGGYLELGIKKHRVSAVMFEQIQDVQFRMKFFNF